MKRLILCISCFLFAFNEANSQTNVYHPFPDSNAVWNMHYYQYCFGPVTQENYSILMSGDTVISSQTYHKLSIPYVQVITSTCGLNTTTGYKGAVRQDIALKKVFFVPPSSSTEELFYDFNLQVGDTVVGYFGTTFSTMPEIVQSIDSVLVGGNYHKRWQINPLYQVEFIEGVGSTYGLFVPLPGGNITEQPQRTIVCFSQNDTTRYPFNVSVCNAILPVGSVENTENEVLIYPNPCSDFLTIQFANESNNRYLQIVDIMGKVVVQQSLVGLNNFVDLRDQKSGFYFVKTIDHSTEFVKKILIQNN